MQTSSVSRERCGPARRGMLFACLTVPACALLATGPAQAASFVPIASVDADPDHFVLLSGLSGNGLVAIGQRYCVRNCGDGPFTEAIRWTEAGGVERLGLLPGGYAESVAIGIDEDGSQIVGLSHSALGTAAFRWRRDTGMVDLDPGPPAGLESRFSVAFDLAADGSVVVGYRVVERRESFDGTGDAPITVSQPFVWTETGGMRGVDVPDPRGQFNEARAVTPDGRFVVGSVETLRGVEAFVWDEAGGLQTLGGPMSDGFIHSGASAISDDGGTIVGRSATSFGNGGIATSEGFLYTRAGGMQRLGDSASRWATSGATAVSGDGSVVVGIGRRNALDAEGEAFVFDVDHGVRPLVEVLASLGIELPGWQLTSADSISADGRTILGLARDPDGQLRSFIAVIPEPATAMMIGVGLAWLARRRAGAAPRSEAPARSRKGRIPYR